MNAKSLERAYRSALQRIEETERLVRSLQDQVRAATPPAWRARARARKLRNITKGFVYSLRSGRAAVLDVRFQDADAFQV